MKYLKKNLLNKKFLENEIKENLKFIINNINFNTKVINIHIQKGEGFIYDYPRMFFIIHLISRLHKNNLINFGEKELLDLFWGIYEKAKNNISKDSFRYVDMYGMRTLNNLNQPIDMLIKNFSLGEYSYIFSYPVTTYIYLSVYNECSQIKDFFPYSETIYLQSLQTFDYILSTEEKNKYLPFHFSELSLWPNKIPGYLLLLSDKFIRSNLDKNLNSKCASSGIAKLLEHFTRTDEFDSIEKIFSFLSKRNVNNNINYINFKNPILNNFKYIYNEYDEGQYICLDTNGHIIHALLNIYEKI